MTSILEEIKIMTKEVFNIDVALFVPSFALKILLDFVMNFPRTLMSSLLKILSGISLGIQSKVGTKGSRKSWRFWR